ncbi:MAG: hypothetical protein CMH49_03720 [Myxococcales bacterium]|nr:hypothetical protein [Myxococcales bacterium]
MNTDLSLSPRVILTLNQVSFSRSNHHKEASSSRAGSLPSQFYQLSQLSAQAYQGDIIALIGDSGVGKTSLLRLILGFECLKKGQICWQDKVIQNTEFSISPAQRGFAYVAQNSILFPHLNVIDNVCFGLNLPRKLESMSEQRAKTKSDQDSRVLHVLSDLGLTHLQEAWPYQLSGGQQKRVALARAMVLNSPLVLLDEPFNSLDMSLRESVQNSILKQLKDSKTTIIWSTHDTEAALKYADYLWILEGPNRLIEARTKQLYHFPPSRSIAERFGELDYLYLKDLIDYDFSWAQLIDHQSRMGLNSIIALRSHEWSLYPTNADEIQMNHGDLSSSFSSVGPSQLLQLKGRVINIDKEIKNQNISIELCSTLESSQRLGLRRDQTQTLSIYSDLDDSKNNCVSAKSQSNLRLDLPKSHLIRMTLASHFPISIGQTLQIYYLGALITLKS